MRTYGKLELFTERWVMSGIAPNVAIRLKQLFPRVPKSQVERFAFPHDKQHCADLSWFIQRYPMEMSARDSAALATFRELYENDQTELESILTRDYLPQALAGLRAGQVIRPYQGQAIDVLSLRHSLLLGDDLGLGKTYTAAGFMLTPGALPAAVVVQTHLQNQWSEKITEFTTLRVHKIKGTKPYLLPPCDVYVFKYSQLRGWIDHFAQGHFRTVVYDEVQELRTGDSSDKGRAAAVLSTHADFRLGLSATPIYNYGSEVWNIMRPLDDTVLGSWLDFSREWLSDERKVKDPQALGAYLREQHVFLRRTKAEVGQQVPPINRIIEIVESDDDEIAKVESIAQVLARRALYGTFTERGQASRELDLLVRHATGVGKAKHVAAYCRILLEAGMPIMLMGWHRDVYDIWLKELADFKPVMYTGSESPKQKDDAKRAFLAGETNLFIMSLRSGAGLDGLQGRCSTVVFGELDWSPKVHEQVIGRLDREGQTEQVTAIYLNSEDGSDPPMVDVLGIKHSQSTGIIDPDRAFEAVHSDASRIKALAQRFLSARELKGAPPSNEECPGTGLLDLRDAA